VKEKPVGPTPSRPSPPIEQADDRAQPDREDLLEGSRLLLRETDEKKARKIIAALGWPEGTPEFEVFLRHWRDHRETEGWQKS
jgi:hypothetical protein